MVMMFQFFDCLVIASSHAGPVQEERRGATGVTTASATLFILLEPIVNMMMPV